MRCPVLRQDYAATHTLHGVRYRDTYAICGVDIDHAALDYAVCAQLRSAMLRRSTGAVCGAVMSMMIPRDNSQGFEFGGGNLTQLISLRGMYALAICYDPPSATVLWLSVLLSAGYVLHGL
eukprot:2581993-Rhodomonas_salina.1